MDTQGTLAIRAPEFTSEDPDPCHAYPFWEEDENYFVSGSNHAGEIRGLMLSGCHVGIAADHFNAAGMKELLIYARGGTKVFVDSGAFGEVSFEGGKILVKRPISHGEWKRRLRIYLRIAKAYHGRAYVVAPDRVADQEVTLARLGRYAEDVARVRWAGANVIVPVQKGALPMAEFFREELRVLGIPDAIPGIPSKKDATSLEDVVRFSREVRPFRVHLLGLGPKSPRYLPTMAALKAVLPRDAEVTCDSVRITALVGRGGKKPRPLTAARDQLVAEGYTDVTELKALSLQKVMMDETRRQIARARELGWRDPELE